ncbi:hypothetical protein AC629_28310 [Bradyrhizobium sp. NAS80.1]|uniref:alpha/beta fold hydrolase n=1 Tax=Bradyrhizobium sp. NAS80.1 TaxID=1680159 RepID=UPI00096957CE|nr:alpha/beta fold hydrolase [Bradyrhizobium sp. NAS80.1]OKO79797.1 hypothetical protein AC629_28310 [Bradyrhizobium sp. NAS80.1]
MAKLADFYVSVLKNSELGKVHLIGSSLGGWLASEIAVRDQSLLRSLVLLAPASMNSPEIPVPDLLSWSYPELLRQVLADPKIAEQVLSQPLSAAQQELRANNGIAVARLGRAGLHNPALAQSLSTVKIATTIIWGDTDRVTPTDMRRCGSMRCRMRACISFRSATISPRWNDCRTPWRRLDHSSQTSAERSVPARAFG